MYHIKYTNKFKKSYKLMKKRGYDLSLLEDVITKLSKGIPLEEKHRNHMLTGNFAGYHECHIKPDWLLIYLIENDILTLTMIDTGSHSDLF
ncbi:MULTISPECIES: type II toxin-antitoxin system YafQ family toxin [unclassified Gemella]|uniref:type II toxin-antitoxin system YafQ family toxin n=1 Tax=unclassified Gemella TaxID=2624949 RepID=UPI001C0506B9|nr:MULTISPECIES: type II toxin-antitoxin system YafQ family toxin [unclassified Gemella]MBU0278724.1 type II toxin-antitoxin system YafQ family toxin [Gemella sp. zg-1178]QWQ38667.1 type II toxin-antitoxin system YafQ family toxin [Gemella sp. zg-570]